MTTLRYIVILLMVMVFLSTAGCLNESPKAVPPQEQPSAIYGCPGCPSDFMDFAEDMCTRHGLENYTVSDGVNTLQCSEVQP